jgi:PAS domain S-box-containing protein
MSERKSVPARDYLERIAALEAENAALRSAAENQSTQADDALDEKRMLEVLNETAAALSAELNLERLVQTVTDAGVKLVGAQFGAFFYNGVDENGQNMMLYALAGAPREAFSIFPIPRRTALFGPTFDGAGILRSDDITKDPRYGRHAPHYGMPRGHLPVRSYLAVPVISRAGTVLGGLFFGHSERGVFTARSERVILGIAAHAAIAVDNARLVETIQDNEQRFRAMIEHSADGIAVIDANSRFVYVSPAASKIEGFTPEELSTTNLEEHCHPEDLEHIRNLVRAAIANPARTLPLACRRRRKDGKWLWLEGVITNLLHDPAVRGIVINYRDITERIRTEELQMRSQKMEALGTLAGGIAHDFNNILLAIAGNTRLAKEDLPENHPVQESLSEISKASHRASDLVRRILTFSRQDEGKRELTRLQPIVEEALNLLRATLPAMIDIKTRFDPATPSIAADTTQIHQIMVNLLTNASHAIGDAGGTIEVIIDTVTINNNSADATRGLRQGQYARLTVSDNGCGMDQATLARIFDPFFTTKPVGQGTGLGLSMVQGIMKSHDGIETVHSEPGKGTTFRLYFPACEDCIPEVAPTPPEKAIGRGERVLYIDDDEAVVFLTTRLLGRLGYMTRGFSSASRAVQFFTDHAREFDVVVTDLSMPDMTGFDMVRAIRNVRADIPVVLTSGHFRPQDRELAHRENIAELVLKPDTVAELVQALDRSLSRCHVQGAA